MSPIVTILLIILLVKGIKYFDNKKNGETKKDRPNHEKEWWWEV